MVFLSLFSFILLLRTRMFKNVDVDKAVYRPAMAVAANEYN